MPAASPWGSNHLGADAPGIIATQSTHKQLASFSQASQIHVKDRHIRGQRRRIEHRRFNEFFMLHASTSPVLSAVRLPRRRRADDERALRRGAVGRHHPARHRAAQEGAGDPARVRGQGAGPGAALVLRGLRARPRHRRGRRRRVARDRLGERADRRPRRQCPLLGTRPRRRLARLRPCGARLTPSPIPTS